MNNPTSNPTADSILSFYEKRKPDFSWHTIADILNTNKGTAWAIAHGKRPPTQEQELRWLFWLTFGPSADYRTVPAIVCPTCGQLHQAADCHGLQGEVRIVPAGARIVQPKPVRKPAPKRDRIEVNRYIERGFDKAEIVEIVREVLDNGRIPSWVWNHPGMAAAIRNRIEL